MFTLILKALGTCTGRGTALHFFPSILSLYHLPLSPSLTYDCCPQRSEHCGCGVMRVELWKASFSSDHHPSHYLPCSRQFPLLSSPDELAQAQECGPQECFLPPFSPHPTSPESPSFPSAICLNPLRCIPEPELGEHSRGGLASRLSTRTLVSVLGPTPARSAVWLLHSSFL